jgi:hypothetical protein
MICCSQCRFWDHFDTPDDEIPETGECHRRAPVCLDQKRLAVDQKLLKWEGEALNNDPRWPQTQSYDWCGDAEERR